MFNFDFKPAPGLLTALSVSDVNRQVRNLIENDPILENLSVEGEISNLSRPASGHIYFTLKDAKSALKCVMWKTAAYRYKDVFKEGGSVIASGRLGVYEPSGVYQLYADKVENVGAGKRYEEFLRLKEKLEAEGLFGSERKRPLPAFPRTVGVVTSASGAALQDILTTLKKRWPALNVLIAPSAVQGVEAPAELTAAFKRLVNAKPDVILIGRGGGSMEDLWAFNDETLVRTVAGSPIPVVSGVGHEIDFTLVDFAADLRAATPTAAAVAAVPDRNELLETLDTFVRRMDQACGDALQARKDQLAVLRARLLRASPDALVSQRRRELETLSDRLNLIVSHRMNTLGIRLDSLRARLAALDPAAVLKRGYAIVRDSDGNAVTSAARLRNFQPVRLIFKDGERNARIDD